MRMIPTEDLFNMQFADCPNGTLYYIANITINSKWKEPVNRKHNVYTSSTITVCHIILYTYTCTHKVHNMIVQLNAIGFSYVSHIQSSSRSAGAVSSLSTIS